MQIVTFLNILSASIGLLAALFFAAGMVRMTAEDVWNSARMQWDINEHLVSSIASQRAEYIVGSLLLLLSFSLQLLANLVPSSVEPSLLQPFGCAIAEIVATLTFLLVCSSLLRGTLSKSTKGKVLRFQAEAEAKEKEALEAKNRMQT